MLKKSIVVNSLKSPVEMKVHTKKYKRYKKLVQKMTQKSDNQKDNQTTTFCHGVFPKLTKVESEIWGYLSIENLSTSQIAMRRGCSKQAVNKIRKKLQQKGIETKKVAPPPRDPTTSTTFSPKKRIRLHAQKWRIKLKDASGEYLKEKCGKSFTFKGQLVQCYEKVILVQANVEFWGVDEDDAAFESLKYWGSYFILLENDLGVSIWKDRRQNVRMTYAEWATAPSDLAEATERRDRRVRIFAPDGKLRLTTDWSDLHEHEAHHAVTGKEDSEIVNRHLDDWMRNPQEVLFSELVKSHNATVSEVGEIAVHLKEAAAGLNMIIKLSQLKKDGIKDDIKDDGIEVLRKRRCYIG